MQGTKLLSLIFAFGVSSGCSTDPSEKESAKNDPVQAVISEQKIEYTGREEILNQTMEVLACGSVYFSEHKNSETTNSEPFYFMKVECGKNTPKNKVASFIKFERAAILPYQKTQLFNWTALTQRTSGANAAPYLCFRGRGDSEPCSKDGTIVTRVRSFTSSPQVFATWKQE